MGCGAAEMWTSPALPLLEEKQTSVTVDQGSLIASLYNLGAIIGYLLYPFLVDRIGRKYTLLTFALPQIISWTLILTARSVFILYLARLIGGIGYGAGYVVEVMYEGEIAEKDIRGLLLFFGKIFYNIGSLIVVVAGAFSSYDTMNIILLTIPIIFISTFIFMPESPYFYLKCNREEDAIYSLSKLRGTSDSRIISMEINRMKEAIIVDRSPACSWNKLFENRFYRKALIITLILKCSIVFSGFHTIVAYTQEIFSYSGFSLDPQYAAIVLESVVLICIVPTAPLADCLGRRILTLCSGIVCSVVLGLIGLFFFFKFYLQIDNLSAISWIPLVALIIFKVAFSSGLANASAVMDSEIFPLEVKSSALSLIHVTKEILLFIVKLGFERSVSICGTYGVFWIFSLLSFVLPLIGFSIMLETKGYSLEEIQLLLH